MTEPLYSWDWVVQLNTFAAAGGKVTVDIDGTSTTLDVADGLRQQQFAYTGAVPDEVTLSMSDGEGTVCVTDVIIGGASPLNE
jgi:hypothetical protein